MRLQAFLARSGAAPSRRKAEAMISAGRVVVNGGTAPLGATVTDDDHVLLDGRPVNLPEQCAYLILNKPAGYLTTLRDEPGRDRRTIRDLMPDVPGLVSVGRLDAATTGLLILTNDGPFAHRLAHPSFEIEKEYEVTVKSSVPDEALRALAAGPDLDDGAMIPPKLTNLRRHPRQTTFHLTIHEGRNRIIRRACSAVGLALTSLKRVRVGPVMLGSLPEGRYRPMRPDELETLQ